MLPTESSTKERIAALYLQRERLKAELGALEDGTLPWLEDRDRVTPAEMAQEFGLTPQAANNRLVRLLRVGLVERERVEVPGGGKAFAYRSAP